MRWMTGPSQADVVRPGMGWRVTQDTRVQQALADLDDVARDACGVPPALHLPAPPPAPRLLRVRPPLLPQLRLVVYPRTGAYSRPLFSST